MQSENHHQEEHTMDALAILEVSGSVAGLMYLLRWAGVSRRWAMLLVPLVSALCVGIWAYANGPIERPNAFSYVAGWVAVATSAATVWGFSWAALTRLERRPRSGRSARAAHSIREGRDRSLVLRQAQDERA